MLSTIADDPPPTAGDSHSPAAHSPATIHEAELASGPSGAVLRGSQIELAVAIQRRQSGLDIVVCGEDVDVNRNLAAEIEAAVGPATRPQHPHRRAGPAALPHFHQLNRAPDGHAFYETEKRKSRKKS